MWGLLALFRPSGGMKQWGCCGQKQVVTSPSSSLGSSTRELPSKLAFSICAEKPGWLLQLMQTKLAIWVFIQRGKKNIIRKELLQKAWLPKCSRKLAELCQTKIRSLLFVRI